MKFQLDNNILHIYDSGLDIEDITRDNFMVTLKSILEVMHIKYESFIANPSFYINNQYFVEYLIQGLHHALLWDGLMNMLISED